MNKFPIFLLQFTFKCEPNAKHCDFSFFLTSSIIICISMYYIFTLDFSFFSLYVPAFTIRAAICLLYRVPVIRGRPV